MANSGLPLDTLSSMTVAALNKSDDYMNTAGRYLVEAQERVLAGEAGDIGWEAWYALHIQKRTKKALSLRTAQRYMTVATQTAAGLEPVRVKGGADKRSATERSVAPATPIAKSEQTPPPGPTPVEKPTEPADKPPEPLDDPGPISEPTAEPAPAVSKVDQVMAIWATMTMAERDECWRRQQSAVSDLQLAPPVANDDQDWTATAPAEGISELQSLWNDLNSVQQGACRKYAGAGKWPTDYLLGEKVTRWAKAFDAATTEQQAAFIGEGEQKRA